MEEKIFEEDKIPAYLRSSYKSTSIIKAKIREALPFMISNQGEIICIPKEKDTPTVGAVGARRTGKSLVLHGLADRSYHYLGESCFIANDYMNECLLWSKPQRTGSFINKLEIAGEKPLPLPTVPLYPNSIDFIKPRGYENKYLKIALDYDDFINHFGDFCDLGKSEAYYMEMRKLFLEIKGDYEKNINRVIDEEINQKSDLMKRKLKVNLLTMIHDLFVDTGQLDVVSKIKVTKNKRDVGVYHPVIALMASKLVPILMTNQIYDKDRFFPAYFSRIMNEIFYDQIREGGYAFEKKRVTNVFIDELHTLVSKKRSTPAQDILDKCVAQSGPARLGFFYCDQNYSKVPKIMADNTKYLIAMAHNSKDETDLIADNFSMPKSLSKEIRGLDKQKQECVAVTSERFLVYDIANNKKWYESGAISGTFLPPLSHCLPPVNF